MFIRVLLLGVLFGLCNGISASQEPLCKEEDQAGLINYEKVTHLFRASQEGNKRKVEEVLQATPEDVLKKVVDCPDAQGRTALMVACERGHAKVAQALLRKGASLSIRDKRGKTAYSYALQFEKDNRMSVLLHSCIPGHLSILQLVVEKGDDREMVTVQQPGFAGVEKRQRKFTYNGMLPQNRLPQK